MSLQGTVDGNLAPCYGLYYRGEFLEEKKS